MDGEKEHAAAPSGDAVAASTWLDNQIFKSVSMCLIGMLFVTRGGLHWLEIFDSFACSARRTRACAPNRARHGERAPPTAVPACLGAQT